MYPESNVASFELHVHVHVRTLYAFPALFCYNSLYSTESIVCVS